MIKITDQDELPLPTKADSIPMILTCPSCGVRHIDEGEFATRPHHTHACQSCGMVWRPAIVPTVGVRFLPGFMNHREDGAAYLSYAFSEPKQRNAIVLPQYWIGDEWPRIKAAMAAKGEGFGAIFLPATPALNQHELLQLAHFLGEIGLSYRFDGNRIDLV